MLSTGRAADLEDALDDSRTNPKPVSRLLSALFFVRLVFYKSGVINTGRLLRFPPIHIKSEENNLNDSIISQPRKGREMTACAGSELRLTEEAERAATVDDSSRPSRSLK